MASLDVFQPNNLFHPKSIFGILSPKQIFLLIDLKLNLECFCRHELCQLLTCDVSQIDISPMSGIALDSITTVDQLLNEALW